MTLRKTLVAAVLACCSFGGAQAATLDIQNNILVGVTGLQVNGKSFNVAFQDGSCDSLFNGCSDSAIALPSQADASAAAQALLDQVFFGGTFDDVNPGFTAGCAGGSSLCFIRIAHANGDPTTAGLVTVRNFAGNTADDFFNDPLGTDNDTSVFVNATNAVLSPVPLPAAGFMMFAGLAGLFATRRKS